MSDLSKEFQFPIKGYILFSGQGHLIAAFSSYAHAMEAQQLFAEANRGSSYTIMWCDGYSAMVCDKSPEPSGSEGE
jgi:hypothetical protein